MLRGDKVLIDSFIVKPKRQSLLFVDEYATRPGYS
jgi:hypothetical protein